MKDGDFDRLRIPVGDEPIDLAGPVDDSRGRSIARLPADLAAGSAILAGAVLAGLAGFALLRRRGPGDAPADAPADAQSGRED